MIIKIAVILCAVVLIEARLDCEDRSSIYNQDHSPNPFVKWCKSLSSEVTIQAWYQAEAFLKVDDGTFTVELLKSDSTPSSLTAEGRGIVRLQRGFARISSLEWFSLENNFIERIESSVFEGLPELTYLSLARNRISYIDEHTFHGLSKLKVLNLNYNRLKGDTGFQVDYKTLPSLTRLYLQHNQLEHFGNYGQQSSSLCKSNLEELYLSDNSIRWFRLSPGYERSNLCLTRLTHLFLEDNDLKEFEIGKLPLEALSLDGNDLRSVPKVTSRLKFLSLSRNRVMSLPDLRDAENIVYLILSHNMLGYQEIYGYFRNLSSLEYLALDNNFLPSIPSEFFHNLTSLRSLHLGRNRISNISPTAFANVPELREISFSNNRLTNFPGMDCFGQSNLSQLDLSYNKVENISALEANMIPELKVLKLTGNPLKRLNPYSVPSQLTILF